MTTFIAASLIEGPVHVLAVLLGVLALLFALQKTAFGKKLFGIVPVLLFCYFVPTLLSNTGVIPMADPDDEQKKFVLYEFVKDWFLPASLFLFVIAVDLRAIFGLGRNVLILFATAFVSIVLAGPLAFWIVSPWFTAEASEDAWRGLAALSGSWIGGGANMLTIKENFNASDDILPAIIVVDVAIAEIWTAVLFWFAGRERAIDAKIGADRASLDRIVEKAESYQSDVRRPTDLPSMLAMIGLAIGSSVIAHELGPVVVDILPANDMLGAFAWKIILITTFGLALSFTRIRRLEGAGASAVGGVMLYLLVATIGAKAHFARVAEPENLPLLAVGALWMIMHVTAMLMMRRYLKAPIFFAAIGSRACIGGAASSPIVAAAFNPALVPIGVMLAILGYVVGTFGGLMCGWLLRFVHGL